MFYTVFSYKIKCILAIANIKSIVKTLYKLPINQPIQVFTFTLQINIMLIIIAKKDSADVKAKSIL